MKKFNEWLKIKLIEQTDINQVASQLRFLPTTKKNRDDIQPQEK